MAIKRVHSKGRLVTLPAIIILTVEEFDSDKHFSLERCGIDHLPKNVFQNTFPQTKKPEMPLNH
jgi:hypothetical protein